MQIFPPESKLENMFWTFVQTLIPDYPWLGKLDEGDNYLHLKTDLKHNSELKTYLMQLLYGNLEEVERTWSKFQSLLVDNEFEAEQAILSLESIEQVLLACEDLGFSYLVDDILEKRYHDLYREFVTLLPNLEKHASKFSPDALMRYPERLEWLTDRAQRRYPHLFRAESDEKL